MSPSGQPAGAASADADGGVDGSQPPARSWGLLQQERQNETGEGLTPSAGSPPWPPSDGAVPLAAEPAASGQLAGGPGRWIPPNRLPGSRQMAIDAWLLGRAAAMNRGRSAAVDGEPGAALRVYRWSRPTLSLGHHQTDLDPCWRQLAQTGQLDLVRRPSGGRAVLHAGDLTYALIWPNPPRRRREAYAICSAWLQACFAELGLPLQPGGDSHLQPPPSCFASATDADLVHVDGGKRIGSAQLWRHGAVLQHGSIQLNPPEQLWRQVFSAPAPKLAPLPVTEPELIELLVRKASQLLPMVAGEGFVARELSDRERAEIAAIEPNYRVGGGADTDTSPAFSIERAT